MGDQINSGAGHTFQPPCLCRKDEGRRGERTREQGRRTRRVRKEMFVFDTCHSPIRNDQTRTNSSLSHCVFPPPLLLISTPPFRAPSCVRPHPFSAGRGIEGTHPPPFPYPTPFAHPPFVQAASLAPFASLSLVARRPSHALSLLLRGRGHRNGQ